MNMHTYVMLMNRQVKGIQGPAAYQL